MKKSHLLSVRIDPEELEIVRSRAQSLNWPVGRYIRSLIHADDSNGYMANAEILSDLLVQTKREGTNLNQIARRINRGRFDSGMAAELDECIRAISSSAKAIADALQKARRPF